MSQPNHGRLSVRPSNPWFRVVRANAQLQPLVAALYHSSAESKLRKLELLWCAKRTDVERSMRTLQIIVSAAI
jgi:hypothetical protein